MSPIPDTPATDEQLTLRIAEWAASTHPADLPDDVTHQVRRSLIDYLAATIVGAAAEPAAIVRGYLADHDTSRTSTVIATDVRLSPPGTALVNGTAAHAYELDDGYTPGGGHPGCTVISAALAAAESVPTDPDQLVRAIALGYEVACRLGGATHPAQWRRGFHNTPLFGTFGAATAVATILDLDSTGYANAFGLAGSHAGGLLSYHDQGSDVKRYHAGKAARDGVVCAELADRGLTAPTNVLEGAHGYLNAFAGGEFDRDHLVGELGTTWRMTRTYHKPHACCRHVHAAVDAALRIRDRESLDPATIESITVETFSIAASYGNKDIRTALDAQMSLPYSVAAALVEGEVGMEQFTDSARSNELLGSLCELTEIVVADDLEQDYPANRPARVRIRAGGHEFTDAVAQPYGEPDNPMTDQDLDAKFRRLVTPILGSERTEAIDRAAWALNDIGELFALIGGAP
ncbi:MAG: MmgE/PrpD family protein [Acidimicrobiia bacterium]